MLPPDPIGYARTDSARNMPGLPVVLQGVLLAMDSALVRQRRVSPVQRSPRLPDGLAREYRTAVSGAVSAVSDRPERRYRPES